MMSIGNYSNKEEKSLKTADSACTYREKYQRVNRKCLL
jgi:hypothetical protein